MKSFYMSKKVKAFITTYMLVHLALVVLIPLAAVFFKSAEMSLHGFCKAAFNERTIAAYKLTFRTAFLAATINGVFGFLTAWTLVRHDFPGKRIMDALIDFPFALPTAVAGLAFADIYSAEGWIGSIFAKRGIQIAYTESAITLVLVFVSLPFMVRCMQPVLEELDQELLTAAESLGASGWQTFLHVALPFILPAWITGFTLSFARAIGEYGSVIFVSGNIAKKTEIASLLIVTRLEQFDYAGASAIAVTLLAFSFCLLLLLNLLEKWSRKHERA